MDGNVDCDMDGNVDGDIGGDVDDDKDGNVVEIDVDVIGAADNNIDRDVDGMVESGVLNDATEDGVSESDVDVVEKVVGMVVSLGVDNGVIEGHGCTMGGSMREVVEAK